METQNNKLNDLDRLLFEEVDKANPSEDVIKQLVLQGANINAYDTEDNVILTFLESVNDRFNWYGNSETSNKFPDEHDFKILQTLLELGADPNSIMLFDDR
ncbi:MAG: hypothetical protein LBV66_00495, partial [Elusimicrobiota bacterium]|nr:hypothetical protein [Elusimicrobiota bacterium]